MNRRGASRALLGGVVAAAVLYAVRTLGDRVAFVVGAAVILVGCAVTTVYVSWRENRQEPTSRTREPVE